jgi:hypothetical protein
MGIDNYVYPPGGMYVGLDRRLYAISGIAVISGVGC